VIWAWLSGGGLGKRRSQCKRDFSNHPTAAAAIRE
jgi:hypothetical protein